MSTRLVVVSAGLSAPSSTRLLADRLVAAARDELSLLGSDAQVEVIELREHAHALADHLVTGFPGPALGRALDAVTGASGLVVVTPVYNGSYSGLFKTFVDVLERGALAGTPVLVGATGGTARHSLAIDFALRPLFAQLRAAVVPTAVFAASSDWGSDEAPLAERVQQAGAELAAAVHAGVGAPMQAPARSALGTRDDVSAAADPYADPTPFAELLERVGHSPS